MTARVLIVDDIPANLKLLEAKLTAEYFGVIKATSGPEALELAAKEQPDIVLLDVMMPGMDGFEVCRRMKAEPDLHYIPVVMVTALDQQSDRVQGLECGADDFLTKPVDDLSLFARLKNLVRVKTMTDELRMRETTRHRLGALDSGTMNDLLFSQPGRILLLDDRPVSMRRFAETLSHEHEVTVPDSASEMLDLATSGDFDLAIISLALNDTDGLRLCSQVRSHETSRQLPIVVLIEEGDTARLVRALDMGVNDYLVRPVDRSELVARCRTQLKRKRFQDRLKSNLQQSLEMAVTDPLTGLYNRHYLDGHLSTLVPAATRSGKPLGLFIVDIDYFKSVNDTHGHSGGDEVLREFGKRLMNNVRGVDLACRLGGEEFVVVMPDTDMSFAYSIAERLRQKIAETPFVLSNGESIDVTISIGVAVTDSSGDSVERLFDRADQALYRAKRDGRNRVVAEAA